MTDALKNYVRRIDKLPTIPAIAHEILNLVGDETVSVNRLESIIENDPAISGKILSVANSAFFGSKQPIKMLDTAIMRIGFNNVKNIALGISIMTMFDDGKTSKVLDYQRIFNHSVSVGFIARRLSEELKLSISEEIFINGILHDVGFLVLSRYFSDNYEDVLKYFKDGQSLLESEENVMGFNHADMGEWLANQWQLPNNIKDSIQFHHAPSLAGRNLKYVSAIHIADYISTKNILSPVGDDPGYPLDSGALEAVGISDEDLNDLESKIVGYVSEYDG